MRLAVLFRGFTPKCCAYCTCMTLHASGCLFLRCFSVFQCHALTVSVWMHLCAVAAYLMMHAVRSTIKVRVRVG